MIDDSQMESSRVSSNSQTEKNYLHDRKGEDEKHHTRNINKNKLLQCYIMIVIKTRDVIKVHVDTELHLQIKSNHVILDRSPLV